jgi:hypothetical protein
MSIYTKLGKLALLVYQEYANMMCDNNGEYLERSDGCCLCEDKDIGCQWHDFCKLKNAMVKGGKCKQ